MCISNIKFKLNKKMLKKYNLKSSLKQCKHCGINSMDLCFVPTPSFDNYIPFSSTRISEMHGISNLLVDFPKPWLQLQCYLCGSTGKTIPIIEGSNSVSISENTNSIVIEATPEWIELFGKEIVESCSP